MTTEEWVTVKRADVEGLQAEYDRLRKTFADKALPALKAGEELLAENDRLRKVINETAIPALKAGEETVLQLHARIEELEAASPIVNELRGLRKDVRLPRKVVQDKDGDPVGTISVESLDSAA